MSAISPGIKGTFTGSCVVCLRGTGTGLVFLGEPEWLAAGLVRLGLPMDDAVATTEVAMSDRPDGWEEWAVRVCSDCAGPLPVGVISLGTLPAIRPRPTPLT